MHVVAHVARNTREFLPLHLRCIMTELPCSSDVPRYISDFFPQAKNAYGTCLLRIRYGDNSIEMLPLIQVRISAPDVVLRYDSHYPRDRTNFAVLLDVQGNTRWREYVERWVTGIAYFTECKEHRPHRNQLVLNSRHTVGEAWMVGEEKEDCGEQGNLGGNSTPPAKKPEHVKRWLEFAGISHLDEMLDDVGIEVAAPDGYCGGSGRIIGTSRKLGAKPCPT